MAAMEKAHEYQRYVDIYRAADNLTNKNAKDEVNLKRTTELLLN